MPQLFGSKDAGAHGGDVFKQLFQGHRIAAADKVYDRLFEGERVVDILLRFGLFRVFVEFLVCLFFFQLCF